MQVVFHCGAHGTDEDRLLKTLLRNIARFQRQDISVPGPGRYRQLLKTCFAALMADPDHHIGAETLWDQILDGTTAERVLFSNPHFFGSQRRALDGHLLYPEAEARVQAMRRMFPTDRLEIFIAMRDPGGFIPNLLEKAAPERVDEIAQNISPQCLRWSDLFQRLRRAAPDVAITTWCYEDMPLLWGQIIRRMAALDDDARLDGGMDLLAAIMSGEGMKRLRKYLGQFENLSEGQRQKIFAAFLDKYADDSALTEEIDLPGWNADVLTAASAMYDQDVEVVSKMDGIRFLAPEL
ncbi:hypothetical protein [Phaeobacter sp.]|uniref:hypothetical protein n=1 Tax=Phaeobacter sp. TaxID=1902409 RepID=UPI0025DC4FD6|nr:hypothetical protein [Phaeobacter sp.]